MLYTDFCTEFNKSVNRGDVNAAHVALMQELGRILVRDKQDFVDLLNESGYEAHLTDSDIDLVDTFVRNVDRSPSLMLGASMLTAAYNRKMGFDGEDEYLNDDLVKTSYNVMVSYFGGQAYSNSTGPIGLSTLGGAASGGLAGTIVGAVGDVAKATSSISQAQQRKKYGSQDIASQKEESKQQLIQGIIDAKKQQAELAKKEQEEKAKTRRTLYIAGGAILAIATIGVVIYVIRKRRRK